MGTSALSGFHRYRIPEILATVSRLGLAAVFLYAAVPKLLNWYGFSATVERYHLLPAVITPAFALLLASLELVIGILLLTGIYIRTVSWLTVSLNILFIIAMGQAILRGIDTSCGCFSTSADRLGIIDIGRDIGFIAMAVLILWREKKNESEKMA